jgi:hypothetical protein
MFINLELKGIFRQKIENKLDDLTCEETCLTHKLFIMKYKELVYVR